MIYASQLLFWLPPPKKEDHLPQNLCQVQSWLGWFTQKVCPLVHRSFPCTLSTGTNAQPKARGVSCAPCRPGTSFLRLSQLLQCSNPARLETENSPQSRKKKALLQVWDGTLQDSEAHSQKMCLLYASSTELSCHKSSNMSLSSCFLCQPQKQTKNFQTLQTAQLSWVSLPEVLMVQEAASFSRRCSQCLHSGTASSIIKTQWERMKEGQKESLSLAWRNKGTLPCCTWNSFTPTAEQKLSELCQELQETYRRGCIGQC